MTLAPPAGSGNDTAATTEPLLLLDENESARACGVSRPTFRRWVAEGLIAPVALPFNLRRNLYRRADVEAFVESLAAEPRHGCGG